MKICGENERWQNHNCSWPHVSVAKSSYLHQKQAQNLCRSCVSWTKANIILITLRKQTRPYYTILHHKWPYIGQFVTICDHTGPYGVIRDHMGPCGAILNHTGPYGAIQTIQDQTKTYCTIQDHTVPNGTIRDHTRPYGTIHDHTWPYGTVLDQTGQYRTIQGHTGPFGVILGHMNNMDKTRLNWTKRDHKGP